MSHSHPLPCLLPWVVKVALDGNIGLGAKFCFECCRMGEGYKGAFLYDQPSHKKRESMITIYKLPIGTYIMR